MLLSGLSQSGLIKNLMRFAHRLTRISTWFMGLNKKGQSKKIKWQLIEENGVGISVPTISAEPVVKRIAEGRVVEGVSPCMGLSTPKEFFDIAKCWAIYKKVQAGSYQQLLGEKAWQRLHPDIQNRFCVNNASCPVVYQGVMHTVYSSKMGKLLAQLCRIIGTPLALYDGVDIPTEVKVYPNPELGGMCWDRFYQFPSRKVNRVKSTKCIHPGGGLVEMVGYGFGMHLKISEQESALCFESTQFFWALRAFKVPIPDWLSPGKTTVKQKALNDGEFQFSLTVKHSLFGRVFYQVGTFREKKR